MKLKVGDIVYFGPYRGIVKEWPEECFAWDKRGKAWVDFPDGESWCFRSDLIKEKQNES